LPGFTVMAAADEAELVHMVATAAAHDTGPIAVRYPRGAGTGATLPDRGEVLPIGKGRVLRHGEDVAILSFGAHLSECMAAAEALEAESINVTVADARFAKPLDGDLVAALANDHRVLVTVEQGAEGGFGSVVMHELARRGAFDRGLAIRNITLPDRFIDQASPAEMYESAGMTAMDIAQTARSVLSGAGQVVPLTLAK
jgi:1-deoxy-D-xylulose-5-phosphate synthase